MKVWMNGGIVEPADAKVSVMDHGLLYGDGVFEGIRSRSGYVLDLDLHLERFDNSARSIYLSLDEWKGRLRDIVLETLAAEGKPDCYVRLVATRGPGWLGIDVASCRGPEIFCIADTLQLYAASSVGLRLVTATWRRPEPDALDPRVKSLNYLNNVLNKYEAKSRGGDEALVLNRRGVVAEASGANVFIRRGTELFTPPASDCALSGITRGRVMRLAPEVGSSVTEETLTRYDVLNADEVFLTGTGARVVPVGFVDGIAIQQRGTPIAPKLLEAMDRYAVAHGTPVPGVARAA